MFDFFKSNIVKKSDKNMFNYENMLDNHNTIKIIQKIIIRIEIYNKIKGKRIILMEVNIIRGHWREFTCTHDQDLIHRFTCVVA